MGKFLLTSTGLSAANVKKIGIELIDSLSKNLAIIVTTASNGKEHNKYNILAKQQLLELGFKKVLFVDLENEAVQKLLDADVVYVSGGNTYKLMKFARQQNFDVIIKTIANTDKLFIGVSAGSIILGKSVKIAGVIGGDKNEVGLKDLSGFALVDYDIHPHYQNTQEGEIKKFENKNDTRVLRITDEEAILYDNDKINYIQ